MKLKSRVSPMMEPVNVAPTGGPATFDPTVLLNSDETMLMAYVGKNLAVWRCPADPRSGPYNGPANPTWNGTIIPATRSYSMSSACGSVCLSWFKTLNHGINSGSVSTVGAWLDGSQYGNTSSQIWATFGRSADFSKAGPSQIFMIVDESPYSINDGSLGVTVAKPQIVDWPGISHANGCGFGFCDGHSEIHKWRGVITTLHGPAYTDSSVSATDPDWLWISQHASIQR